MSQDARVKLYSIMVEHDRAVLMIEQTTDRAKLDHDLIVPITMDNPGHTSPCCHLRAPPIRGVIVASMDLYRQW